MSDPTLRDTELRSASRRLAAQFALTIVGLFVALGIVVYSVVAAGQAEAAKRALSDASMVDSVHDAPRDLLVTVVTPQGRQSSPDMPDGLPDEDAIEQVARTGNQVSGSVETDGQRYLTVTDVRNGKVVQVAYGLGEQQEELSRLVIALVVSGVIATIAAGGIGLILARRSIRPLADALALQRRFVADAGHELRTPLTLLSTRAQLLRRHVSAQSTGAPDEELRSGLDEIVDDSRALTEIVQDLLTAADPRQTAESEGVDLGDLAATVVRSAKATADERGLTIAVQSDPDAVVTGAPVSLRRMIVALMDNALDHAAADVRVSVSTSRDRVILTVEDDGPGFSAGVEDRAFERFATARDAQPDDDRGRHYGLGLALVAEVVNRHSGSVEAANRDKGGAVVTVRLPRRL
ncbi:His Kinase A (phospho-acceptor) domain-containing protein [Leifsonia sp. 98AMF]|uniref:sensor histidine kinase n=1 Tax=unclassified Leifsonia TaxID=2663824 RepID=UPI00087A37FA|nr:MULTISPECIES: HAMP domain-containing sensor histidine kinase [unclassified Leifsonia]SDG99441.1 His Kinase A (phospho-acceptor) domain-containing protein [Leifsonia sp. 197AMF]SDJ41996.1 His Kinase A (phospho-acceptor) domain-containing protein [Leifsonia sp. 466MF]SDK34999.1 His Kinase A (phospho-acceptor) domain-containing protein [Leifsonia sp. 157MF]SDN62486.1 His Kinase A (phospho-acceptor) domain-containing protein [Leifsonia sp. 509MF]SEN46555.1 His Kinase A (phospho-acceptor) domain